MPQSLNWNRAATCADPAPGVEKALLEGLHGTDSSRGNSIENSSERRQRIRTLAAKAFHFPWPERVIFTSGATFALNQAVRGIADGARVLVSELEHNSLLRPLHLASKDRGIQLQTLAFGQNGVVDQASLEQLLETQSVDWLAIGACSNVFGTIQPLAEICALARKHGVKILLDLSQGAGQMEFNLSELGASYAAMPAHKGLRGPRGIGLLFVNKSENPLPLLTGGTGTQGESLSMPQDLPTALEAGTPNLPGIFALGAALEWLQSNPCDLKPVRQGLKELECSLRKRDDVKVFPLESNPWSERLGILSFLPLQVPGTVLAGLLAQTGLQVRSGMMCAALASPAVGATEGLVRLSPPTSTTPEEFRRGSELLHEALNALNPNGTPLQT